MERIIRYYIPKDNIKNKAGNANLTIDWFKKKFLPPFDSVYFQLSLFEEYDNDIIPQLKSVIFINLNLEDVEIKLQGVVESIVYEKSSCEIISILLKPI